MKHAEFDRLLTSAFHGGEILCRELRLSEEQVHFLTANYSARLEPMGEQWYQVTFYLGA